MSAGPSFSSVTVRAVRSVALPTVAVAMRFSVSKAVAPICPSTAKRRSMVCSAVIVQS